MVRSQSALQRSGRTPLQESGWDRPSGSCGLGRLCPTAFQVCSPTKGPPLRDVAGSSLHEICDVSQLAAPGRSRRSKEHQRAALMFADMALLKRSACATSNRSSIFLSCTFCAWSCSANRLLSRLFSASRAASSSKETQSRAVTDSALRGSSLPIAMCAIGAALRLARFRWVPFDVFRSCGAGSLSCTGATTSAVRTSVSCCFGTSTSATFGPLPVGTAASAVLAPPTCPLAEPEFIGPGGIVSPSSGVPGAAFELNGCGAVSSASRTKALRSVSPQIELVRTFVDRRPDLNSTTKFRCGIFI